MYSVVVPTFNRAGSLSATLESLLAQDTTLLDEIIVVDNNSSDATRSAVQVLEEKTQGKLRYVFEGKQGLSMAKNAGIAAAHGDVIAFVDDDTLVDRAWLKALAGAYRAHPDAWCVGGKIIPRLPEACPSWFSPHSETLMTYLGRLDYGDDTVKIEYPRDVWGGNFSVTRAGLSRAGLFNTRLGLMGPRRFVGEETELCWRIQWFGGGVYYCGQAVVHHIVPPSRITKRFFRQRAYWQGRTDGILFPQADHRSFVHTLGTEGLIMLKDWGKACACYGMGRGERAFVFELAACVRLGYLLQVFPSNAQVQSPAVHSRERLKREP